MKDATCHYRFMKQNQSTEYITIFRSRKKQKKVETNS